MKEDDGEEGEGGPAAASRGTAATPPTAYECMQHLVVRNRRELDVYYDNGNILRGPHSHVAQHLVVLYRLGAGTERLQATYDSVVLSIGGPGPALRAALPPAGRITDANWRALIGAGARGETAGPSVNYTDYVEFYRTKIAELGEDAVVRLVLPRVVDGLAGGLYHPAILLGCYYEVGGAELLAQGLAWMSIGYVEHAPLNPSPRYHNLREAMDAIHADTRLPTKAGKGGRLMADQRKKHAAVMSEYDLALPDAPAAEEVRAKVRGVSVAVLELFASAGCDSVLIAHLCTSARAMQVTLARLDGLPALQAHYLRRHWQGVLYVYAAYGKPKVARVPIASPLPPWGELAAAAAAVGDSHLAKMVYLCRENCEAWGVQLYHQVATSLVRRFQSGRSWRQPPGYSGPPAAPSVSFPD